MMTCFGASQSHFLLDDFTSYGFTFMGWSCEINGLTLPPHKRWVHDGGFILGGRYSNPLCFMMANFGAQCKFQY